MLFMLFAALCLTLPRLAIIAGSVDKLVKISLINQTFHLDTTHIFEQL